MKIYIYIFSVIMFVFGFIVKCISSLSSYFPLRVFSVAEFIGWNIIRTLWGLFSITVNKSLLFWNKLFWLSISCGGSEWKLGGRRFRWVLYISESRINFSVGEFDKVLICVYLFFLLLWWFIVLGVHRIVS